LFGAASGEHMNSGAMVTGTLALTLAASFSVSSAHAHKAHGKHGAGHSRGTGGAGLASVYSDSRTQ
jgi:uncharacterized membrane protein